MNLKIVNKKKFMRSIVLVFLVIIGISFFVGNKSFSHAEINIKQYMYVREILYGALQRKSKTQMNIIKIKILETL